MKGCFSLKILSLVLLLTSLILSCGANEIRHQYCIVGAGPSGERIFNSPCVYFHSLGLQMGYFLHRAKRDYIIIEKASVAGNDYTLPMCNIATL